MVERTSQGNGVGEYAEVEVEHVEEDRAAHVRWCLIPSTYGTGPNVVCSVLCRPDAGPWFWANPSDDVYILKPSWKVVIESNYFGDNWKLEIEN